MDGEILKDEISKIQERLEDRQMLGLGMEHDFWEKIDELKARMMKLSSNEDLINRWNALIEDLDGEDHYYIHLSLPTKHNGYSDNPNDRSADKIEPLIDDFNTVFEPYHDDPPSIDMNNTQLFIHNTQLQDAQDDHLNVLHQSVKTQRHIAGTINSHLNEDAIILGDLENQIDRSHIALNNAQNRLDRFNTMNRNSKWLWKEWILIFGLLILLSLLLKL